MDIIEYINAGTFFMGVLMLVCAGMYFMIADIPGALKATRTEEAKTYLSSAKARKQASSVVKKFQQEAKTKKEKPQKKSKKAKQQDKQPEDIPYLEGAGEAFENLLFPEAEGSWPRLRVIQAYSKEQKATLNELMQKAGAIEAGNGIRVYAGGEMIEFK